MRFKLRYIVSIAILTSLLSCGEEIKHYKNGDTVFFPDTAQFLREWKMTEKDYSQEAFIRDSGYAELPMDTFLLTYHMCDCPDWELNIPEDPARPADNDYYIEAADSSLEFPWEFYVSGNKMWVYGRVLAINTLPQGGEFTVPNPPKWKVIRYYGFEVVRPYWIWGPKYKEFQAPGDTIESTVQLQIR